MAVELYSHQEKAVKEIANGKILKGGVGTGKSRTALAYFFTSVAGGELYDRESAVPVAHAVEDEISRQRDAPRTGLGLPTRPRDIFVITTARKRDSYDWVEEALPFRIGPNRELSIAGIKLTVDSWNNVVNYREVENAFFIFDEQRLVGSGAWVKAFLKIAKANEWIMLSATPGDNWMDYVPVFIANGYYKNRAEFLREHVVFARFSKFPKIDRYLGEDKLRQIRAQLLVDMPFARHTVRHDHITIVDHDEQLFDRAWTDRWDVYKEEPLKDVGAMFHVARRIVNSDPSRLGAVMEIFEKHKKLIIFYNFNYERDALRTLASTLNVNMKEWNGDKHEFVPDGDEWLYLVQYTSGNEAWNCITTDTIVFYSLNYSWRVMEQCRGRVDRLNTPFVDLHYYILRSNSKIDQAINKALKQKKNFNEKDYLRGFESSAA